MDEKVSIYTKAINRFAMDEAITRRGEILLRACQEKRRANEFDKDPEDEPSCCSVRSNLVSISIYLFGVLLFIVLCNQIVGSFMLCGAIVLISISFVNVLLLCLRFKLISLQYGQVPNYMNSCFSRLNAIKCIIYLICK